MKKKFTLLLMVIAFSFGINAYAQTIKLAQSFEGATFPPSGWTTNSVSGANVWTRVTGIASLFPPFPNGSYCAAIDYETAGGNDYLITPQIAGIATGDTLIFYWIKRYSDGPYPPDSCIVLASTTTNSIASFTNPLLRICVHCTPVGVQVWNKVKIPLSQFNGQSIYLAFQHKDVDGHGMGIDSVRVVGSALPAPAGPITGPTNICQSTNGVVFSVGAIANATSYVWTVPAGATIVSGATTNSITVNFGAAASSGSVTVYGTNAAGNGTASSLAITLLSVPVPVITGPSNVCCYSTGNVYSTVAGMTAYVWNVPTGGTITAGAGTNSITVTWNTAGNQTVTVNYTNAGGCAAVAPTVFPVTVNPSPVVNAVPNQTLCNGTATAAVPFSGGAPGTIYSWVNNTPTIGLAASGTGDIPSFTATNTGASQVTATVTVTPTAQGASPTQTFNGTLAAGDGTLAGGRLFRDAVPSVCGTPKVYPGLSGTGPYYYDTYTFTNTTGSTQCVTVTYVASGTGNAFATAYSGSFNPANLGTNYLADGGSSSVGAGGALVSFGFNLANGATVVIVVNEATVSEACTGYTLTVSGLPTLGCSGLPVSFNYIINPLPTPSINGSVNVCVNSTGNVYTTAPGMASYTWAVSAGGTITAGAGTNSITVTWNTVGVRTVSVSFTTSAGCTTPTPSVLTVNVLALPATPTITGSNSVCAGSSGVTYTTQAGFSNYNWTISYDGVITSGLGTNQVTVNWATAGSRYIAVNYSNAAGCSAPTSGSFNVSVLAVPVPLVFGEDTVCQGTTGVTYTTQPNNSGYAWTISSGGTITAGAGTNTITVSWNTAGVQTVSANYTNALGCPAVQPTVYNVYVAPKPATAGTITGTNPVCAGATGVIYSVPAVANATTYNWTVPAGATITAGATTNTITISFAPTAAAGIMKVNGVNSCGSGASSPNFNLVVNPIPATPVITKVGDTLISNATTGNQWYLNGVLIAGATSQKFRPVHLGNYTVVVTLMGCSSVISNTINVTAITALSNLEISRSFEVYPNPTLGQFNISAVSSKPIEVSIEIFNNVGSLQWKQEKVMIDGSFIKAVDLRAVPAGVYMVAIRNKDINVVRKVVIMK